MFRIFSTLILAFNCFYATAASIDENLSNGMKLRAAVVASSDSGDLSTSNIVAAMRNNPDVAALVFIYSVEAQPNLLDGLVQSMPDDLGGALIDAVLVAIKYDVPVLRPLVSSLAEHNVPLAQEAIYAVTEVFPEEAKQVFDWILMANVEAREAFESSYTDALAAADSEGTRNGEIYEAYEPEDDVSPA